MRDYDLDKETMAMIPDKPFLTVFPTFAIDSEDMTNNEKIIFIYLMSEVNSREECKLLMKDLERVFKMTTEEIDEATDRLKRRKLLEYARPATDIDEGEIMLYKVTYKGIYEEVKLDE